MTRPFKQGRFADLPEKPRVPHPYFEEDLKEVEVVTEDFGATRAAYRAFGEGPPLLLVHGLMTSSYSWRYVLEPLGRRFRLFCPDLVGAGRSSKPDAVYSAPATARWVGAFQRAVGIRGCPVVGNSLGGYLCMHLALQDPEAMSRLVNLHSPGFPELRLYALRAVLSIPGAAAALAWLVRDNPLKWSHRNVHYFDESLKSLEEARVYGEPLATAEGARAFTQILRDTLDPFEMKRFQDRLSGGFPVPLQLIYAPRDPMVRASFGPRFAERLPEARLVVLSRGSHFAHVDAPELFLEAAVPFLIGGE